MKHVRKALYALLLMGGCFAADALLGVRGDVQQAWAAIASLAVSAATAAGGAIANARAKNKQRRQLGQEQQRLEGERQSLQSWYDREYYQNPLDTEEAKAAQATAREHLAEENKKADMRAAMTGASDEARIKDKR